MSELNIGDTLKTGSRTVTIANIEHFAEFTGDKFYAHMDEEAAKASPIFEGRVAHGYLILSFAAGLFVDPDPGPVLANTGLENLRFLTPLYPGDSMRVELTVKSKSVRNEEMGEVRWAVYVFNQKDVEAVMEMMTPDVVFENTSGGRFEGQETVRAVLDRAFGLMSAGWFETEEITALGDRAVVLWEYVFDKEHPERGHIRGADVFRVRGDRVAEKFSYVKSEEFVQKLGLQLPSS